jgi:hypothetical protein
MSGQSPRSSADKYLQLRVSSIGNRAALLQVYICSMPTGAISFLVQKIHVLHSQAREAMTVLVKEHSPCFQTFNDSLMNSLETKSEKLHLTQLHVLHVLEF